MGVNIRGGKVTNKAVADTFGLPVDPIENDDQDEDDEDGPGELRLGP